MVKQIEMRMVMLLEMNWVCIFKKKSLDTYQNKHLNMEKYVTHL